MTSTEKIVPFLEATLRKSREAGEGLFHENLEKPSMRRAGEGCGYACKLRELP